MKTVLLRLTLQIALTLLLKNTSVSRLLATVEDAARTLENNFARKGHVYRSLKELEGDQVTESVLNLAVEMGVVLMNLSQARK